MKMKTPWQYFLLMIIWVMCSGLTAQQTIESTNGQITMKFNDTEKITMNSGPPFFIFLPSSITLKDIFGNSRITLFGNELVNDKVPNVVLTGEIDVDTSITYVRMLNSLHGGTWGLGLGSYQQAGQNLNTFDITLNDEPQVRVDEDGSVFLESEKFPAPGLRPLYVDSNGKISSMSVNSHIIHYSEFTANDGDGGDVEIVRPGSTFGFGYVRHKGNISDEGELVAPIHLPDGSIITRISLSYINEADEDEPYELILLEGPIQPNGSSSSDPVHDIPVGGEIIPANGFNPEMVRGATHSIEVNQEINNFSNLYSLIIRCDNCSEQYLRACRLTYTLPE